MSARIQKILSFAVGMDNSDAMRALRAMYAELGKARTATRPLSDSMNILKGVVAEYNVTSAQQEIIQNRLILQSAKRAEQVRKEAQAVRELAAANSSWAAGLAKTVEANKPFNKGLQGLKDNNNRDSRAAQKTIDDAQFAADEARILAEQQQAAASRRRARIEQANREATDDKQFAADEARILAEQQQAAEARAQARRRTRIEQANRGAADEAQFAADEARILAEQQQAAEARAQARRRTRIEQANRGAADIEQFEADEARIRAENQAAAEARAQARRRARIEQANRGAADEEQFEADEARIRTENQAASEARARARRRARIEQANRGAADIEQFEADEARIQAENQAAAEARARARRRTRIEQANRGAADEAQFEADEARIQAENQAAAEARRTARRRALIEQTQQAQDNADRARNDRLQLADAGRGYMSQFNDGRQNALAQFREANTMFRQGAISAEQYGQAVAGIRAQNNALVQSFAALRTAVTTLLGPLVLVYTAYRGFVGAIKLSAELDEAKAKFRVFTGSMSEAVRILKDVRALSSESPVSFQGGQRALTTMLQYGVEAKNITGTLRTLAEITGGNTERMESLSLAYAQANAAGRLMGQELLQMVNAGFNPLKVISEQTGKSMADLKAEMQDGQISFAMVEQAFKDATREGGQFYGLLDEISNTTAGKLNKAQSSLEQFGIAFGDMLKPVTDGTLDLFINDVGRMAQSLQMVADLKLGSGSLGGILSAPISGAEILGAPSYIQDFMAASKGGANPYSEETQRQAAAVRRLGGSSLSEADKKFLDEYAASVKRVIDAIADGKDSKAFAGLTDAEKDGAEFLLAQREKAKREDNKGLASFDKDVEGYKKLRDASKDFNDTQKAFIALVEKHGQGRFSQKDIDFYKRAVEAQEKLTAATKEQERVQEALKGAQDAAKKDLMGARYGDKTSNAAALQEQATGAERKRLDAMIAAGAAYNDLVLAANDEAQANMDALDAIQEKTKAIEEAAAAEKKTAEAQAKFEENERQKFKTRRNKYLADLKGLEDEADQMRRDADPNSALIEGLAKAELLKSRGIITNDEFNTERNRLAGDAVKNVSAAANPVIGKGTQEAYQFITGQQVDTLTLQLKETEKQTILATTAVDVAKRSQELLEELVEGIPEVVGP